MKKSKYSESQIVNILKEAEVGISLEELVRQHGFSKASFYKWKAKYSGHVCLLLEANEGTGRKSTAETDVRELESGTCDAQGYYRKQNSKTRGAA